MKITMAGYDWQSALAHFSHPHILEQKKWEGGTAEQQCCSGCRKPVAKGLIYSCTPCKFHLHLICAHIPFQIHHPADNHPLNLLSEPSTSAEGACKCKACGQVIGHGFFYNCDLCQSDLHPSCANLPMKLNDSNHGSHELILLFSPPYPSKAFTCNVCREVGGSWVYHCFECDFDLHVKCTQIPSPRKSLLNNNSQAINRAYVNYDGGRMERGSRELHRYFPIPHPSSVNSWSSFQMQQQSLFQHMRPAIGTMIMRPAMGVIMQIVLQNIFNGSVDWSDIIGSIGDSGFFQ